MNVIVVQKGHNHDHGHKKQVLALLVDFMMGVHSSRRASVTHDAKPMTTMTRAFPACVRGGRTIEHMTGELYEDSREKHNWTRVRHDVVWFHLCVPVNFVVCLSQDNPSSRSSNESIPQLCVDKKVWLSLFCVSGENATLLDRLWPCTLIGLELTSRSEGIDDRRLALGCGFLPLVISSSSVHNDLILSRSLTGLRACQTTTIQR